MKKDYKGYAFFAFVIVLMIVIIICSEKYLVNKMVNKTFTLYTKEVDGYATEKTLNTVAYDIHGIFAAKEEAFDAKTVMGKLDDKFEVESNTLCYLSTNSVKGEILEDIVKCRIYAYDQSLNHFEVQHEMLELREIFFTSPKELGKYIYVFEIEYENKDKLTYSFYLDVVESIKNINYTEEKNSYKDLDKDKISIDTMYIYSNSNVAKYITSAKRTEKISRDFVPYKVIYMYDEGLIKRYDVFKVENNIVFYDETNNQYLLLDSKYTEKFSIIK